MNCSYPGTGPVVNCVLYAILKVAKVQFVHQPLCLSRSAILYATGLTIQDLKQRLHLQTIN